MGPEKFLEAETDPVAGAVCLIARPNCVFRVLGSNLIGITAAGAATTPAEGDWLAQISFAVEKDKFGVIALLARKGKEIKNRRCFFIGVGWQEGRLKAVLNRPWMPAPGRLGGIELFSGGGAFIKVYWGDRVYTTRSQEPNAVHIPDGNLLCRFLAGELGEDLLEAVKKTEDVQNNLRLQFEAAQAEIKRAAEESKAAEARLAVKENAIQVLQRKVNELTPNAAALEELRFAKENLGKTIAVLRQEAKDKEAERERRNDDWQQQVLALAQKLAEAEQKVESLTTELRQAQEIDNKKADEFEKVRQEWLKEISGLQQRITRDQEEIKELEAGRAFLNEVKKENCRLTAELKKRTGKLDELEQTLASLRSRVLQLQAAPTGSDFLADARFQIATWKALAYELLSAVYLPFWRRWPAVRAVEAKFPDAQPKPAE